jgi:hypothetical protein
MKNYNDFNEYMSLFDSDENNRKVSIFNFKDLTPSSKNLYYPNVKFFSKKYGYINPSNEKIMSLQKLENVIGENLDVAEQYITFSNPVFFFIYNTDNYFHFIYDTLPYLISFFELRKEIPNLKLLMSNPNKDKNKFYPFVYEFLEILGITKEDVVLVTPDTKYSEVFISDSYTHGINSNLPPRKEVYSFFKKIVNSVDTDNIDRPKNIYISRRSHKHGDYSNIGTNYTDRRKLMNEDDLVIFLEKIGYTEIFTELLTTKEKILLFSNAERIIGPIGGGLCNTLFCKKETKLLSIISPNFLEINQRFSFCFDNIDTIYFEDTYHYEKTKFKSNMRVKCGDIVGEVINIDNDYLKIQYSDDFVSGWNKECDFNIKIEKCENCEPLDDGLNSPWILNLEKFKNLIQTI